jgi:hypothetical protein
VLYSHRLKAISSREVTREVTNVVLALKRGVGVAAPKLNVMLAVVEVVVVVEPP